MTLSFEVFGYAAIVTPDDFPDNFKCILSSAQLMLVEMKEKGG